MPIRPEMRGLYPPKAEWLQIRRELLERGGHRCEGSPKFPDCRAENRRPHPVTGSYVVLTVGHLDHDPTNNGTPGKRPNLRLWCQRCHLHHDQEHHAANARRTRRARRAAGELFQEG